MLLSELDNVCMHLGSLVCVMQDNDIFAFGLVVRRDVQAMARGEVLPSAKCSHRD